MMKGGTHHQYLKIYNTMTPFEKAYIPDSDKDEAVENLVMGWHEGRAVIRQSFPQATNATIRGIADKYLQRMRDEEQIWKNDTYQVAVRRCGVMSRDDALFATTILHLSIKRLDKEPIHDWRDLQKIKNELVGPECEGIELYPAESRLVDTANQFHLWVVDSTSYRFEFGFNNGRAVEDTKLGKSKQRAL